MLCLHVSGTTTHIPHLQRARHQRGRYVCVVRLVEPNVVRGTCIVHVGGPRCGTWNIDQNIQMHPRTTWGVELIRANCFHRFLVCLTYITTTIHSRFFSSMFDQVQGACLEIGGTRGMHALPKCVVSTIGERHG